MPRGRIYLEFGALWKGLPVALGLLAASLVPAGTLRVNVLVLLADDQRFDTIHALGNAEIRAPHLDRLVREGFAFIHAFIMGSGQPAVCVPSRAVLMTGRTLFRATTSFTNGSVPRLASTLSENRTLPALRSE